jgi:uncharacterized protein (TIGR03000 family)
LDVLRPGTNANIFSGRTVFHFLKGDPVTKFITLAIGMAALALTLATPGVSNACWRANYSYTYSNDYGPRWYAQRGSYYPSYEYRSWRGWARSYRYGYQDGYVPFSSYAYPGTFVVPMQAYAAMPVVPANTASIRVMVPADAKLWFDGEATKQTGSERIFESPPLTPGKAFAYDVKAQWRDQDGKEVTQTRHVVVRANGSVSVEFTLSAE